jgi:starch phosphorylase
MRDRDPVCGAEVADDAPWRVSAGGLLWRFCSQACRQCFVQAPARWLHPGLHEPLQVAYFSMEIELAPEIPTYAGGLGVLAGDTLRASADLGVPMVGVTLLYRHGYFRQTIDAAGEQREAQVDWQPERVLTRLPNTVELSLDDRTVQVAAWQYDVAGASGASRPVILLDTDLEANRDDDRKLTHRLYGGDERCRLAQEIVLGIGGVRMLAALGHGAVRIWHMNEGHSALLAFELLRQSRNDRGEADLEGVRHRCVFTTHTPVPAGTDVYDWPLVQQFLRDERDLALLRQLSGEALHMTRLGLATSHYINGVALRHREVSHTLYPGYPIDSITNGVHTFTWATDPFRAMFDRHVPGWRTDPAELRHALSIPRDEIWQAHTAAKRQLLALAGQRTGVALREEVLTIGLARRMTPYKRLDLLFHDLDALQAVARAAGGLQVLVAGKAHPRDEAGKAMLARLVAMVGKAPAGVRVVFLEDYDAGLARTLAGGVDLWLNTPRKPHEASGTSGMKAAVNGVPQLSTQDGWWLEGGIDGVTGWSVGARDPASGDDEREAHELYRRLETEIVPRFRDDRAGWLDTMRHTIAINAAYFNAHRMMQQYVVRAYVL